MDERGTDLRLLNQAREQLVAALQPYGPELLTAYDAPRGLGSQQLEFLAELFNGTATPMLLPTGDFGHAMARRTISFGADMIELGAVDGEPPEFARDPVGQGLSERHFRGDARRHLSAPVRDAGDAELRLRRSRAGAGSNGSGAPPDALCRRRRGVAARRAVGGEGQCPAGRAGFGEHHLSILVRAADPKALDVATGEVQAALAETGFA